MDRLPDRFMMNLNQFSYTEKFDTWLDLGSWVPIVEYIQSVHTWADLDIAALNNKINKFDLEVLRSAQINPQDFNDMRLSPLLPAKMILYVLTKRISKCHVKDSLMRKFTATTNESTLLCFNLQYLHLISGCDPNAHQLLSTQLDNWTDKINLIPPEIQRLLYVHEDILATINYHKHISKRLEGYTIEEEIAEHNSKNRITCDMPSLSATVVISRNIIILSFQENEWICPIPLWLETYNKLTECISFLRFSQMQAGVSLPSNHYDISIQLLKHFAHQVVSKEVRKRHRYDYKSLHDIITRENQGFIYLKAVEGLGVSRLIEVNDKPHKWTNTLLGTTLWSSLVDDKIVPDISWEESDLYKILQDLNSAQIADLIGTVKLCGHPSIEVSKGLEKLYERTHANLHIDEQMCERARAVMVRDIVKNFFRVHGNYPKLKIDPKLKNKSLEKLIFRRVSILSPEGSNLWHSLSTDDWTHVTLLKNSEFDMVDNQVLLLKDKAIGLTRSKVMKAFLLDKKLYQQSENRRALLVFLLDNKFERGFRNYLTRYMEDDVWGNTVLDYLVIKLTAKELEEKPEGRFFGASPAYERNRRVIQEANNMAFLDTYVPEQLLTPNELSIIKKLYSFRFLRQIYPDSLILNVSFDFSKWNNNMRHESVDIPAGSVLDQWFGVNLYSKTMLAFQKMFIYYDDGTTRKYWNGQLGGIEGLNQPTWTFTFLGGLKDAMERLGYKYHITVKGDDVRAAIVIPRHELDSGDGNTFTEKIEKVRDRLLYYLKYLCNAMGWELNPNESFVSLSLIATSKQYQINETWLPTASKKIMKLEAISNVAFPTLEDMIANIFSIAHSTCAQSTVVLPAFITALWTASKLLTRSVINYGDIKYLSPYITSLLLWPQIIGGPGPLPLQTYFVRGENDMLAVSISLLRFCIQVTEDSNLQKHLLYISRQTMKAKPDPAMLLADPFSIDIDCPIRPQSLIKSMLRKSLKKFCKHPDIKKLLTTNSENNKQQLIKILSSLSPYHAKIATALWECSPFYLIEEILAKFLNSSSIIGFLTKGRTYSVFSHQGTTALKKLSDCSRDRFNYWIQVLRGYRVSRDGLHLGIDESRFKDINICSTQITTEIRELAWSKRIVGITYPSLVDQNRLLTTLDIRNRFLSNGWDVQDTYSQINIRLDEAKRQTDYDSHHYMAIDKGNPWLGSQTSSSVSLPFQSENVASPVMRKVRRLLTLLSSSEEFGLTFKRIVEEILKTYTSLPISSLSILRADEGGGHLAHRTPINSYSMTTMPNYRPNISQLISIYNEDIRCIKEDRRNRTINFAARHFFLTALALLPLQSNEKLPDDYPLLLYSSFHHDRHNENEFVLCPFCNAIVDDEKVTLYDIELLDLSNYSSMPMISCSESEQISLIKSQQEILVKGVLDIIHKRNMQADNPIVIQMATQSLIQQISVKLSTLHQNLALEGIHDLSNIQVADAIAVGLGIRSAANSNVSLAVLRCCQGKYLYHSVLSEVFWNVIRHMYTFDTLIDDLSQWPIMKSYYRNLDMLFKTLAQAGILTKLASAARSTPPAGVKPVRLIWKHGYENDGMIAARSFLESLWPTFKEWLSIGQIPESISSPIIEGKTLNEVLFKIHRDQNVLYPITCHLLHLVYQAKAVSTKTIMRDIENAVVAELERLQMHGDLFTYKSMLYKLLADLTDINFLRVALVALLPIWLRIIDDEDLDLPTMAQTGSEFDICEPDDSNLNIDSLRSYSVLESMESNLSIGCRYLLKTTRFKADLDMCLALWSSVTLIFAERLDYGEWLVAEGIGIILTVYDKLALFSKRRIYVSCLETDIRLIKESAAMMKTNEVEVQMENLDFAEVPILDQPQSWYSHQSCRVVTHKQTLTPGYTTTLFRKASLGPEVQVVIDDIQQLLTDCDNQNIWLEKRVNPTTPTKILGGLNKGAFRVYQMMIIANISAQIKDRSNSVIIVLGDGGGSITRLLLDSFQKAHIVMCTLNCREGDIRVGKDSHLNERPVELQAAFISDEDHDRTHYKGLYPGDFTLEGVRENIRNLVYQVGSSSLMTISDADYRRNKEKAAVKLLTSILLVHLNTCTNDSPIIIRVLITAKRYLVKFLLMVKSLFIHMHFIINPFATMNYKEVHIILSHCYNIPKAIDMLNNFSSWYDTDQFLVPSLANLIHLRDEIKENLQVFLYYHMTGRIKLIQPFDLEYIWTRNNLHLAPLCTLIEDPHISSNLSLQCPCQLGMSLLMTANLISRRMMQVLPTQSTFQAAYKLAEQQLKDPEEWIQLVTTLITCWTLMDCISYTDINHLFSDYQSTCHRVVNFHIIPIFERNSYYKLDFRYGSLNLSLSKYPSKTFDCVKVILNAIIGYIRALSSSDLIRLRASLNLDPEFAALQAWSSGSTYCVNCLDTSTLLINLPQWITNYLPVTNTKSIHLSAAGALLPSNLRYPQWVQTVFTNSPDE